MNKASFLSLVRQASHISDQDVAELEKLVVNFPYCQTAHLLIAKAAYDKGSMLSNQKLKKAAIYAANRQLLKKLIHTSDATVALQPVVVAEEEPKLPEEVRNRVAETVAKAAEKVDVPTITSAPEITSEFIGSEPVVSAENVAEATDNDETAIAENIAGSETTLIPEIEISISEQTGSIADEHAKTEELESETEVTPAEMLEAAISEVYEDEIIAEEILTASEELPEVIEVSESEIPEFSGPSVAEEIPEPELSVESGTTEEITSTEEESEEATEAGEETVAETPEKGEELIAEPEETLEDVIDVQELYLKDEPEIREEETAVVSEPEIAEEIKAETDTSEIGLRENLSEEILEPARQGDLLHDTLASFDHDLFKPEKETEEPEAEPDLKVVYAEDEIQTIFNQDSIGYWMSSSRLGESLELKNELTAKTPTDFHPELILEYAKTHELHKEIKPVSSNLSKQLEIIDEFLKMTPRLKAMANSKIKTEPQEDLSFKSSKISKNLATESYANILVQQGKIKKAIKIYEHLILKFPEKKPYFVAQIEKLQNQG